MRGGEGEGKGAVRSGVHRNVVSLFLSTRARVCVCVLGEGGGGGGRERRMREWR